MKLHVSKDVLLLWVLAVCIYVLAITHTAALWFAWYWAYPWFDILTHFLGGACVGIGTIWLIGYSAYTPSYLRSISSWIVVSIAIVVIGVVWEGYEWVVQLLFGLPLPPNYWPDTILDIIMDVSGAFFSMGIRYYFGDRPQISSATP